VLLPVEEPPAFRYRISWPSFLQRPLISSLLIPQSPVGGGAERIRIARDLPAVQVDVRTLFSSGIAPHLAVSTGVETLETGTNGSDEHGTGTVDSCLKRKLLLKIEEVTRSVHGTGNAVDPDQEPCMGG
jgi:hypothetical protein